MAARIFSALFPHEQDFLLKLKKCDQSSSYIKVPLAIKLQWPVKRFFILFCYIAAEIV